jgi:hypothetical protein
MTRTNPTELKRQALEHRFKLLAEQYASTCRQRDTTLNAEDRPILDLKAKDFEQQMKEVDEDLSRLERSAAGSTMDQRQRQLDDALPKIDFREAWRDFEAVYNEHVNRREGGAALLLAPDYRSMCADLFVRRLDDWLREQVGYNKVRRVTIGINDSSQLTPDLFLRRLGSSFDVTTDALSANNAAQVRAITDRLCSVLDRGHLLFIEATIYVDLFRHEGFLCWLLDVFWLSLRTSLSAAAQQRNFLKCLLLLEVHHSLPKTPPLKERYCPLRRFDPVQRPLARLPLTAWSKDDIEDWLVHHSGFTEHWSTAMLAEKVNAIYNGSFEGKPIHVVPELRDLFNQHWNQQTGGV